MKGLDTDGVGRSTFLWRLEVVLLEGIMFLTYFRVFDVHLLECIIAGL